MSKGPDSLTSAEDLLAMLRRRGFVHPAFDLYGGVSGLIDYGPLGGRLRRRVLNAWIDYWNSLGHIVEIESPTLTPKPVLEASGHVLEFNDHASTCNACGASHRSDHLLEGLVDFPDQLDLDKLQNAIEEKMPKCPSCSASEWAPPRPLNLMFPTTIGPGSAGRPAYLRPETAQGMFTQFPQLYRHFRERLPFGAVQVGKGYRNEISPRQSMIRLREFTMAELEWFFDPEADCDLDREKLNRFQVCLLPAEGEAKNSTLLEALEDGIIRHDLVATFMGHAYDLLARLGIITELIRFRQHAFSEMAHYATDCWDLEIKGSYGWVECVGIAHRGCHDLESHERGSKSNLLRAWRSFDKPKVQKISRPSPVASAIGPVFRSEAGKVSSAIEKLDQIPIQWPHDLSLNDGKSISIDENMVEWISGEEVVHGEWFTPHVVEPAFGIDRIIWHIFEHAFVTEKKEGKPYSRLRLAALIAPIDIVVLPLFDKDGMQRTAHDLAIRLRSISGHSISLDGSGSIGRRYARADEAGIPWAITVDHDTVNDGSVTIRRRDDGLQVRLLPSEVEGHLTSSTLPSIFPQ